MTLIAILVVLVAASTALADDKCPPVGKTFAVNMTQVPMKWWYCYSYVADIKQEFCTFELIPETDSKGNFTINYYTREGNTTGKLDFGMTQLKDGIYNVTGRPAPFTAKSYITEMYKDDEGNLYFSYYKCFKGGKWGGGKREGIQAGVVGNSIEGCKKHGKKLAANLKKAAKLENHVKFLEVDQEKCKAHNVP